MVTGSLVGRSAQLTDKSTNQLYTAVQAILGSVVVVLGVYEIPQGNSHYILYVGSLIVLSSTLNQASVLPPANQLCIAIFALASPKNPPTIVAHFQHMRGHKGAGSGSAGRSSN